MSVTTFDPLRVETEYLEVFRYEAEAALSKRQLAGATKVDSYVSRAGNDLVMRMLHEVYAETPREHRIEYPATWWDAFKLRFFPRWALKRWPPRFEVIVVVRQRLYPDHPVLGKRFEFVEARPPSLRELMAENPSGVPAKPRQRLVVDTVGNAKPFSSPQKMRQEANRIFEGMHCRTSYVRDSKQEIAEYEYAKRLEEEADRWERYG